MLVLPISQLALDLRLPFCQDTLPPPLSHPHLHRSSPYLPPGVSPHLQAGSYRASVWDCVGQCVLYVGAWRVPESLSSQIVREAHGKCSARAKPHTLSISADFSLCPFRDLNALRVVCVHNIIRCYIPICRFIRECSGQTYLDLEFIIQSSV